MPQEAVVFDPTLMDSLDEDMTQLPAEFDPDADYNAPPPPLPDGWYQATLSCAGVKDLHDENKTVPFNKRPWGNIPSTFHTSIQAKVIDPGGLQDGKYATDNTVTTNTDIKKGASKAATYVKAIAGRQIKGASEGAHMKDLLEQLQGEPTVWVKTQLEGQPQEAGKAFSDAKKANGGKAPDGMKAPKTYRGDKAFTQEGKLTGRVYDEATKEFVVGRPVIVGVRNLNNPPEGK